MDNIKEILNQVMGQMALRQPTASDKVERILQTVLEPQDIGHIKFVGEKEGTVFLNVDSPTWLFQLNLKKSKILKSIQEEIREIKNINFKVGKVT